MNLAPARAGAVIRIAGSTTVLPVMARAAEAYRKLHPQTRITVNAGGSGVGIQSVGTGRVDIGMASREMTDRERARFRQAGLKTWVIGRDAVACVVSSEIYNSGVHVLSREQIRDIYLGRIDNWKAVGGPDRAIVVIDKERHRGTRHVFMHYVFGDAQARAPGARLVTGSNNEEQAKIAQSDAAIGMLSFSWINDEVSGVSLQHGESVIVPSPETVAGGQYPIARNLNLLVREDASPEVQAFLNFVMSAEGQALVHQAGYLPVRPAEGSHLAGARSSR